MERNVSFCRFAGAFWGNCRAKIGNGGLEICDEPSETHNMRTADVFLPSGVQTRLYDALGYCPRRLPADAAAYVEVLWAIRNAAPEAELDNIDDAMEAVVESKKACSCLVNAALGSNVLYKPSVALGVILLSFVSFVS